MAVFTCLCALHLYANYKSLCVVPIRTLSRQRAERVFSQYICDVDAAEGISDGISDSNNNSNNDNNNDNSSSHSNSTSSSFSNNNDNNYNTNTTNNNNHTVKACSPRDLQAEETFVRRYRSELTQTSLIIGLPLHKLVRNPNELDELARLFTHTHTQL